MKHREGTFRGSDGSDLYYQVWAPLGDSRGIIIGIHGLGDHSVTLSSPLAESLVGLGLSFYALDLRGHGRSPGIRGHVTRWSEYREDLRALLDLANQLQPGLPVYLLGHSLGGLIALDFALGHPEAVAGVVGLCPVLAYEIPAWQRWAMRLVSLVKPEQVMIDRENFYKDVPLAERFILTARLGTEAEGAQRRVMAGAGQFRAPLLLLLGLEDQAVLVDAVQRFHGAAGSTDKVLREYPETGHNPLDLGRTEEALQDLLAWLDRQVPGTEGQAASD